MDATEIARLHHKHCRPEFGTTTPDELEYIQSLIVKHRPKRVIEIGTASGVTTGFIAQFLSENGGTSVTTIDLAETFFAEPTKPVGYLANQIYSGSDVTIEMFTKKTSLDLASLGGPWDMAFIDANHQHPWPTIDTLAVAPFLSGPRIVIHHDLQLYRRFRRFRGIGPRVLFNEMPDSHRHAVKANGWNIFSLDLTMHTSTLEHVCAGALSMPWTATPPLGTRTLKNCTGFLGAHYSDEFVSEFQDCAALNKVPLPKKAMLYLRAKIAR